MKLADKLIFYLFIIAVFVIFLYFKGFTLFTTAFSKVQNVRSSISHQSNLNLTQLQSASLVQEFIFPYDFISRPDINWAFLNLKAASRQALSPEEEQLHQFSQAVLHTGFDLSRNQNSFFIITAKATAGINLDNIEWFTIDPTTPNQAILYLPPATMLNVEIIDNPQQNRTLPNVAITPVVWSNLITFLTPLMVERFEQSSLLDEAERHATRMLTQAFTTAGFNLIESVPLAGE